SNALQRRSLCGVSIIVVGQDLFGFSPSERCWLKAGRSLDAAQMFPRHFIFGLSFHLRGSLADGIGLGRLPLQRLTRLALFGLVILLPLLFRRWIALLILCEGAGSFFRTILFL